MPVTLVQQRNLNFFNVKDFGATGNGVTDDTLALAAAITAASVNGGTVFFPPGIYLSTTQTLVASVHLVGAGLGNTTIKLKNATNADLFSAQTGSINLSAASGSGITGTLLNFSLRDLTLDGNLANQTSGPSYPLRLYGYNFILRDLQITNGFTGGVLIDWSGPSFITQPSDEMESLLDTVKIHDNNGIGLQMGGPHDSKLRDVLSFKNGSHNFHFAPNAQGILALNCHGYLNPNIANVCTYLVEAGGCQFTNCIAEGSFYCNVAVLAGNISWMSGQIYGNSPNWTSAVGIQLGQTAGKTPFPGQILQSAGVTTLATAAACIITTQISECRGGAISCQSEVNNSITANIFQTVGTALVGSAINNLSDAYSLNIQGLTSDTTLGKSGGTNIITNGAAVAFAVSDLTRGTIFQVDSHGNTYITGGINSGAGLYFTASTTPAALASSGTISIQGLTNVVVAPTADVTGVIMQTGFPGQFSTVVNASAFTVTFAASGTSNVANGVFCKILANTACVFFFDNTNSLWYPCALPPLPTTSTLQTIAGNGVTINTVDIDVARTTMTAARTGAILQAGTYGGQKVCIINESTTTTFTINWAVSGTSNVAQGVSVGLNGLASRIFVWDSGTSLWY